VAGVAGAPPALARRRDRGGVAAVEQIGAAGESGKIGAGDAVH
jgi:hypothetical protein